jgi:hypothetical protein
VSTSPRKPIGTRRRAFDAIGELLRPHGFKTPVTRPITIPLADDVEGWVGLNWASEHEAPGELEIGPIIGVVNHQVARLVADLRAEKPSRYPSPTVSEPLGYLMIENTHRAWHFTPTTVQASAVDLVGAILEFGMRFMRRYVWIEELCSRLDHHRGLEFQEMYCRPCAHVVAGNPAEGQRIVDEALAKVGDRSDMAADEFRSFASAFRARSSAKRPRG